MRIAVTGAAGEIGTETVNALSNEGYEVVSITHPKHEISDSYPVELGDRAGLVDALSGVETVIHLAADRSANASWESVLHNNIIGTKNLYSAAHETGVRRVIFASSNHVQHMRNIGSADDPATMTPQPETCRPGDLTRPDSLYGVSKVFGEAIGSYYADRFGLEVLNFRIGWFLTKEDLEALQSKPESIARYARAMWLSPRDCRHAMQLAVGTELPSNPLTVNLLSHNFERYSSITETMRSIGYTPKDNSFDVCGSN